MQKVYLYTQFMNNQKPGVFTIENVTHQVSFIYRLYVGQSFNYKNFPGRIQNLSLCGGNNCYQENVEKIQKIISLNPAKEIVIPQKNFLVVESQEFNVDDDKKVPVYKRFENEYNGVQEFSISGWFRINRGSNRAAWSTGYHFNDNTTPQDFAQPGDRTLAFFIINNILHFCTYDLTSKNNNINKNIDFNNDNEGQWLYIQHSYSDMLYKAYVHTQFAGQQPKVLNFDSITHRTSTLFHLWVGQSFNYRNFPGRIVGLNLCGGNGCYRELGLEKAWENAPADIVIQRQEVQIVTEKDYDYNGAASPVYQKFENKFPGNQEFAITTWIKITPNLARPTWATGYHFNSNVVPTDFAKLGDRTLAFFIINNILHFPTYDVKTNNPNVNQNINIQEFNVGSWALIYHGYTDKGSKAFVYTQFQNREPDVLRFNNIYHKDAFFYHLWVGQSFAYKNFPGRINNLRLCGGSGCYREQGFENDWAKSPVPPLLPKQEFSILDDKDFDFNGPATPVYQKFENKFNGVQEFSITCWIKIAPNVARTVWTSGYHFNSNQQPADLEKHGDRTLSFFVINNTLHFPTYDLATNNINLYKNIDFTNAQVGVWALVYHAYTNNGNKAFVFNQFYNSKPSTLNFPNVIHRDSNIYHLWVGQSFAYKNFPGRINNLRLCGGIGCYRELGFENDWINLLFLQYTQIRNLNIQMIKFSISMDLLLQFIKNSKINLTEFKNFQSHVGLRLHLMQLEHVWTSGYHFNSNEQPADVEKHGDRTLSFFIINNMLHFPTYDLATNNINLYKNIDFTDLQVGVWALVYHAYTNNGNKAFVYNQFQNNKPSILNFPNVIHQDSKIYHLWVGQSFAYKNFPGRINNLRLCGGSGCYREQGFESDWAKSPVPPVIPKQEFSILDDKDFDFNGPATPVYQKFENKFNGVQEFSITCWIKIAPNVARTLWTSGYHFNSNEQPADMEKLGDRTLSFFIINNMLHFPTYDLATNNINLYQNIDFTDAQVGVWALVYHAYTNNGNKAFVFNQFNNSKPSILNFPNVVHQVSKIYHLWVGQSFAYKNFPGRINNLRLCGGSGCYREQGLKMN
ncbi:hypothetical protein IMG5_203340 [Ichthyophthirius multifiliis]|uniref:Uncharacterized protein n=1 Tax=Ichthyophthirius multifiliis TaxID=5932 RepID=G0R6B0_ICHMU|nr:hypothetical protein IMG5_203340 [Ichthyophthirius multifiliis]EGR26994.1 hypothetical protein IMG5_203340 [Ichthyophthirius multifiliis]|eukprot:XP_004023878.1 hypothetical protein IMG5_203340 [Ichthyophthirius multifiliis]